MSNEQQKQKQRQILYIIAAIAALGVVYWFFIRKQKTLIAAPGSTLETEILMDTQPMTMDEISVPIAPIP